MRGRSSIEERPGTREKILNLFERKPGLRLSPAEIQRRGGFPASALQSIIDALRDLCREGRLVRLKKNHYALASGGHLVTGHVDGVGEVLQFAPVGESHELVIRAPAAIAGYIAKKGSITVNGVSLTVNRIEGRDFSINLIPHTVAMTTLKHLAAGSRVNLEIDLIARYVERMLAWRGEDRQAAKDEA